MHVEGHDYIIPVDAPLENLDKLNMILHSVNVTYLLDPIDKIISDMPESSGDAIIYAAASGSLALDGNDYSPFSQSFLEALEQKSTELLNVFRFVSTETVKRSNGQQIPWMSASFNKQFYFDDHKYDIDIGVLKILFLDMCRNNPFAR